MDSPQADFRETTRRAWRVEPLSIRVPRYTSDAVVVQLHNYTEEYGLWKFHPENETSHSLFVARPRAGRLFPGESALVALEYIGEGSYECEDWTMHVGYDGESEKKFTIHLQGTRQPAPGFASHLINEVYSHISS